MTRTPKVGETLYWVHGTGTAGKAKVKVVEVTRDGTWVIVAYSGLHYTVRPDELEEIP